MFFFKTPGLLSVFKCFGEKYIERQNFRGFFGLMGYSSAEILPAREDKHCNVSEHVVTLSTTTVFQIIAGVTPLSL